MFRTGVVGTDAALTTMLAPNTTDDGRLQFRCNRYLDEWARTDRGWLITDRHQMTDWMVEVPVMIDPDRRA